MKKRIFSLLLGTLIISAPVNAEEPVIKIDYSPAFALIDLILYRPVGVAATVAGSALYVGLSPLTAVAQISPPHDAFEKMADILVMPPIDYTFKRPLGEWTLSDSPE